MPIDIKKTLLQIKNLESTDNINAFTQRLNATFQNFMAASLNLKNLEKKLAEAWDTGKAKFTFAKTSGNETIGDLISADEDDQAPHITIGTDGSQVFSSAHEFSSASLINIGSVVIPYFNQSVPVRLASEPTVYNSSDDITTIDTEDKISDEDLISYERTLKEIEELTKLCRNYKKHGLPIVAMLDGTLIHWHLKTFNNIYVEHFIQRFSKAILELKEHRIPLISYISSSRSNDIINMLRIYKCPYEKVDCRKNCHGVPSKSLPCNPSQNYKSILDRKLIEKYLVEKQASNGTRTAIFKSNNSILELYPSDIKVCFFYFHTGYEVARVEIPAYVANDNQLLHLAHNALKLQCKVGFGYPVVLSEAHNQAVVSKKDRQIFYDLLKEHYLKQSGAKVNLSTKELRKRISFV